jgi:hypothetical protein
MIRFAALAFVAAIASFACTPSQPPETPESPANSADPVASAEPAAPARTAAPAPSDPAMPGKVVNNADVDKSASLEAYELTPSDCDALGRQYGAVMRADLVAGLSPKLAGKQREATMAQIEELTGKRADAWAASCQSTLVNKAVDHGALKCALGSKTVKQFDVCLNGEGGTPQPAGKPGKKK